jgi:DNA-binding CsgD family transcriptional regulator
MKRRPGQPKDVGTMLPVISTPATSVSLDGPRHSLSEAKDLAGALPLSVLTTALCLSLWVAFGSLALAVIDGLGHDPVRRLSVGTALVIGTGLALWRRRRVCALLGRRPWLLLGVALAEISVVAVDGLVGGPYVAFTLTSIGIAVVVARARIVWWCAAVLMLSYGIGVLVGHSPQHLIHTGELGGVLGQLLAYPFAALSLLALAGLFTRFLTNVPMILDAIRAGAPALTPALGYAIAHPGMSLLLPPGEPARPRLTPSEIRAVEGLAQGKSAKQLAHEWGLTLATVRTHIKHAKRKTGARTLRQLAGLVARSDWLGSIDET